MYVTINTHKGLFRYNRLPFGISSAPAIFQWAMETLLKDIPGTVGSECIMMIKII